MHKHYTKPMASKLCVQIESAISDRDKRTIHPQGLITSLRNCHKDLPKDEVNEVKSAYMKKLQNSGYDAKYRKEILISAENGFRKQQEADTRGETPLYRPRGYNKVERYQEKKLKKKTWFRKGDNTSFIMIPITPHSKLKKKIEDRLRVLKTKEKIKIVEKP